MSSLVVALDVVAAAQEAVARLELPPDQSQEARGQVAPPVVDLPHDDVPAACGAQNSTRSGSNPGRALMSWFRVYNAI